MLFVRVLMFSFYVLMASWRFWLYILGIHNMYHIFNRIMNPYDYVHSFVFHIEVCSLQLRDVLHSEVFLWVFVIVKISNWWYLLDLCNCEDCQLLVFEIVYDELSSMINIVLFCILLEFWKVWIYFTVLPNEKLKFVLWNNIKAFIC